MKSSLKVFPIAATLAICCAVFASAASRAADDPALQQHIQEWSALKARTGPKADITVRIASSAGGKGQVLIGLYDAVTPFPTEGKHLMNAVVPVAGAQTEYTLKDIPLGDYAIAVICDENGNGKTCGWE
jgi:uncharacterized protein (DUF2141 family)